MTGMHYYYICLDSLKLSSDITPTVGCQSALVSPVHDGVLSSILSLYAEMPFYRYDKEISHTAMVPQGCNTIDQPS